ncbi:tail fiber assembly protein [Citrobacter sp. Cpo126]|uniref:tail fiber assembly protein n=1 Tax=Citrobacter sp. Cpo126 TaxID=2985148 RepID=UPI002575B9CE|nr:tail fiber assembly protein [Citrobacter sp. Cpo126]MDM2774999.1 tail fiber assembly protein [Citrobacter sp. Cpo126]
MTDKTEQIVNQPPIRIDGYIWDAKNIRFLAYLLKPEYQESGMWPENGIDVSDEVSAEFIGQPPEGKILGVNGNGMPAWVDIPPPTAEETLSVNMQKKSALRITADTEISWRQDAVDAGIATAEETAALVEWKKYRVLLMRVDTAKPVWPTAPGGQAS